MKPGPPKYDVRKTLQPKDAPPAELIQILLRTLAAKEAASGGIFSLDIASAAQAVAKAYRDFGQLEEALNYYYIALEVREAISGEKHSSTLNTLDNCAAVFADQLKYQDALRCYQQCLERRKKNTSLGADRPSLLANKVKIGKMLQKLGQSDEALENFTYVLPRYQATLGEAHLSTLAVLSETAAALHIQGHTSEALLRYRKVLEGRRKYLGAGHQCTKDTECAIHDIENGPPTPIGGSKEVHSI